jgi:hypothetical protein
MMLAGTVSADLTASAQVRAGWAGGVWGKTPAKNVWAILFCVTLAIRKRPRAARMIRARTTTEHGCEPSGSVRGSALIRCVPGLFQQQERVLLSGVRGRGRRQCRQRARRSRLARQVCVVAENGKRWANRTLPRPTNKARPTVQAGCAVASVQWCDVGGLT